MKTRTPLKVQNTYTSFIGKEKFSDGLTCYVTVNLHSGSSTSFLPSAPEEDIKSIFEELCHLIKQGEKIFLVGAPPAKPPIIKKTSDLYSALSEILPEITNEIAEIHLKPNSTAGHYILSGSEYLPLNNEQINKIKSMYYKRKD